MYRGMAVIAMMGDSSCLFDSAQAAHVKGIQSIAITDGRVLRQTFDLIWTKNVKFLPRKQKLEGSPRTQMADELMT